MQLGFVQPSLSNSHYAREIQSRIEPPSFQPVRVHIEKNQHSVVAAIVRILYKAIEQSSLQ